MVGNICFTFAYNTTHFRQGYRFPQLFLNASKKNNQSMDELVVAE